MVQLARLMSAMQQTRSTTTDSTADAHLLTVILEREPSEVELDTDLAAFDVEDRFVHVEERGASLTSVAVTVLYQLEQLGHSAIAVHGFDHAGIHNLAAQLDLSPESVRQLQPGDFGYTSREPEPEYELALT